MKRSAFFDILWSKPLSNISLELNIPTNQIRNICKEFKIPMPKPGYWKKLEYGKAVDRPNLPEHEGEVLIEFNKLRKEYKNSYPIRLKKRTKKIQEEHLQLTRIPNRLTKPHPYVIKAKSNLSKKCLYKNDNYERSVRTSLGHISIDVSKSNMKRMLRFVDAFIKLSLARCHEFIIDHNQTIIKINDEVIPLIFREKCNRKSVNSNPWPSTILVPNGKLSVKIAKPYITTEWIDGTKSIEEQLPKIVAALELFAENEKEKREERKRHWEEQLRIQKIKDQEIAKQKFEDDKFQILLDHSEKWRRANNLKAFIDQVEKKFEDPESNNAIYDWINWARNVCKTINPISCNVDSFLDQYDYEKSKLLKSCLSS